MIKKLKRFLKRFIYDESGVFDSYITHAVLFVSVITLMYLFLIFQRPFIVYSQLENYASEVKDVIVVYGQTGAQINAKIDLIEKYTLTPDQMDFSKSQYMWGTNKIQINDLVVVEASILVPIGDKDSRFRFEIPLHVRKIGKSSVYWKTE